MRNDNHLTGSIPALIGLARLSQFRVDSNQLTGNVPAAPSPSALMAGRSSLCPNSLNHTTDPAWDAATGITPWYTNCVDSLPPGGYAPGTTFVISDTNASPTGITYLSVVLGELVPKRLALFAPERIAMVIAPPMRLIEKAATPFVWLLAKSSDAVLSLMPARSGREPPVSDEEIAVLMEQGSAAGVFHESEEMPT